MQPIRREKQVMAFRNLSWSKTVLLVSIFVSVFIIACGSGDDDDTTSAAPATSVPATATATSVPTVAPPSGPAGSVVIAIPELPPLIQEPRRDINALGGIGKDFSVFETIVRAPFVAPPAPPPQQGYSADDLGLAESWEVASDLTSITFKLRANIPWHDNFGDWGNMDEEDVAWTFNSAFSPESVNNGAEEIGPELKLGFDIVGPLTVKMNIEPGGFDPTWVWLLGNAGFNGIVIVNKDAFDQLGEAEFAKTPIGTGKYMALEWVGDDRVVLEAVEDHWTGITPSVKTVTIVSMPEQATRDAALRAGEVDIALEIPPADFKRISAAPGITGLRTPSGRFIDVVDPDNYFKPNQVTNFFTQQEGKFRVLNLTRDIPKVMLPQFGIEVVTGYHGNQLRWYDDLLGGPQLKNLTNARFLNLIGTKYLLLASNMALPQGFLGEKPVTEAFSFGSVKVMKNENALERVFLVNQYRVISERKQIVTEVLQGGYDLGQLVYLEEEPPLEISSDSMLTDSVWIIEHQFDSVVIGVNCTANRILVMTENYYDSWHVFVDDQPAKLLRADGSFRAVAIPAGARQVTMIFESERYATGKLITLSTSLYLLIVFGFFFWTGRKEKREEPAEENES